MTDQTTNEHGTTITGPEGQDDNEEDEMDRQDRGKHEPDQGEENDNRDLHHCLQWHRQDPATAALS